MIAAMAGIAPHLLEVEAVMTEALASSEPQVMRLVAELGQFHGKMLRPSLCLLVAECVSTADRRHHVLGAALELIHTATLIHDDLIDDAATRRGQSTAHVRFGNTTSVLLGDYLYTRAFSLATSLGEIDILERLCNATNTLCEGELHQQVASHNANLSEAEYFRIIYGKTAALTELAGFFGSVAGDSSAREAAASYGRDLGLAFQIVDDCLDLAGDAKKVGKTLATDLERGRMTLPLIRVLAAEKPSERNALEHRLLHPEGTEQIEAAR
ncbi:MAG: polyprenyl synthetase family protein, partial [Planctomycetota bacterium]